MTDRPTVLMLCESFSTGVLEVMRDHSRILTDHGWRVVILHGVRKETPDDVGEMFAGAELVPVAWTRQPGRTDVSVGRAARRLHHDLGPDVIHAHSSKAGLVARLFLGRTGTPILYTPHGFAHLQTDIGAARRRLYASIERRLVRRTHELVAVSDDEVGHARTLGHERIRVVPNRAWFPEHPRRALRERCHVAIIGRIVSQRRPAEAAALAKAVADATGREAIWIGNGPLADDVTAAGVRITDWMSRAEVGALLERTAVVVHWSAWDGLALGVLDAMAAGAPVIASALAANQEALGAGYPTFADVTEAAAYAIALVGDGDRWTATSAAGLERARACYSLEAVERELLALYASFARRALGARGGDRSPSR